jgi:cytochrome c oxidase subunit 2
MDRPMDQLRRRLAAFFFVLPRLVGNRLVTLGLAAIAFASLAHSAMADVPHNWALGFQPAASPVMQDIEQLHDLVFWIITVITVFVAGLLLWVGFRYSAKRNPVPSQTSHNTILEVAWTLIPVLILVVIAIPSFRLIYFQDRTPNADMTIKVTGHQWYWEYSYPDSDNINFASRMVPEAESKLRQLDVDEALVLPVGKNIRILTTSADVIHSFFIPSMGVQRYAIPGRTIETWVRVDRPGMYYGECNQICGTQHSGMPIGLRAVPEAEFTAWVAQAKTKYASDTPNPGQDASRLAVARVQH